MKILLFILSVISPIVFAVFFYEVGFEIGLLFREPSRELAFGVGIKYAFGTFAILSVLTKITHIAFLRNSTTKALLLLNLAVFAGSMYFVSSSVFQHPLKTLLAFLSFGFALLAVWLLDIFIFLKKR